MRFEPYDASIGCLAVKIDHVWMVVAPTGYVLSRHGNDEYAARNQAQFNNLTATEEELSEWCDDGGWRPPAFLLPTARQVSWQVQAARR